MFDDEAKVAINRGTRQVAQWSSPSCDVVVGTTALNRGAASTPNLGYGNDECE
jgi:hypothetical protein